MTDTAPNTAFYEAPISGPAVDLAARVSAVVPVLETPHLRLRAPLLADFSTYAEILGGARGRYVIEQPVSRADIWRDFCGLVATWLLRGHGTWTVTGRSEENPLGFVLVGAEPGDEAHELGFMVADCAEGRGIAFEAAAAARDWAWSVLQVPRLVSYIDPANTRSAALASRLGAIRGADRDQDTLVFEYPHPEGVVA